MTEPLVEAEPVASSPDEPLAHYVCCDDEDIALCGSDRTGQPYAPHDAPVDEMCDRIAAASDCDDVCPVAALRSLRNS